MPDTTIQLIKMELAALRSDLDTNVTSIKEGSLFAGRNFSLSRVNFFETCETSIESICTIQPPMSGTTYPTPCVTSEVAVNKVIQ